MPVPAEKDIAALQVGDRITGFYILKDAVVRTSSSGKPFLAGAVSDRTGSIDLKIWDYGGPVGSADAGRAVKLSGVVTEFKGNLQLIADRIRPVLPEDGFDKSRLVPVAPIDAEERMREILALVDSMEDTDYQSVAREMLSRHGETLRQIPAAKSVHHSFLSGLLMHTSNMLRLADFLAGQYAEVIDRSLLLCGTLIHDIMKEREFVFSDLGLAVDYSPEGQLLGHLVMGAREAAEVAESLGLQEEKSLLLQHLVLSHHGEPEFGAAVRPQCPEAELLSSIDLIDSRMEIYAEALQDVPEGAFSPRVFALDRRVYHHK